MASPPDLPPGFRPVSGKRRPPQSDKEYTVAFRRLNDSPFIDWGTTYRADQLDWIHAGASWEPIAVKDASNG